MGKTERARGTPQMAEEGRGEAGRGGVDSTVFVFLLLGRRPLSLSYVFSYVSHL